MKILIILIAAGAVLAGYFYSRPGKHEREVRDSMADWEDIWNRRIKRGK